MTQCTCKCTCGAENFLHINELIPDRYTMMGKDADGITLFTEHTPMLSGGKWWNGGTNKFGLARLPADGTPRLYVRVSAHTWKEIEV